MDSRKRRDGAYLDHLGTYYPAHKPATVKISEEKAVEWLKKGAQPSETVRSILSKHGILAKWDAQKKGKGEQEAQNRADQVKAAATARTLAKLAAPKGKKPQTSEPAA
jgi:small subunit ribosomal protein S16